MKTCGFCKEFCENDWCITKDEKMSEIDKLLEAIKWTTICTEKEVLAAYQIGRETLLNELRSKIKGMVVNGTVKGILTEDELK